MKFKEHDIEFPAWLQELEFQDESWGNDARARAIRTLGDGTIAYVWVNYDEPERRDLGNCKYAIHLAQSDEDFSDPTERGEVAQFDDATGARQVILALVAAHSQGNIPNPATGARQVDPATAQLLHELGKRTLELPDGSMQQIEVENEFHQIGLIFLDDPQRQRYEDWAVKATTPERVSVLMAQLSLPAIPLEPEDDIPPGAAQP